MPYNVTSSDDRCPASKPYAVVGGRSGNDLFGCHDTKESARKQQQALYAQTDDERQVSTVGHLDPPVAYTLPATVAW